MAKKKKNTTSWVNYLPLIGALLGVVAIIMAFLPAVVYPYIAGDKTVSYTGFQTAFGYSVTEETFLGSTTTQYLNFSFINLLPYILLIGGVVCAILGSAGKNQLLSFIAIACFAVAAVCTFCFTLSSVSLTEFFEAIYKTEGASLGVGAIIGGICSALAAVACAFPVFAKLAK